MGKYRRFLIRTLIGLVLLGLPASALGADQVTLQLIWKNQFQFAGYYMAQELGYYEEAGLDVTIKEYEFGTDVTADVVSQRAQFGVGRSALILESMEGAAGVSALGHLSAFPFHAAGQRSGRLKKGHRSKGQTDHGHRRCGGNGIAKRHADR